MTSTRLPGKVLADLAGKPLLERMIERVSRSRMLNGIVVATTSNAVDDPVAATAERLGAHVFRGDEMDVLGRIHDAAVQAGADPVVRLTADCPMSDPSVIDAAVDLYRASDISYVSNVARRTFPDGLDVEVMSFAALGEAHREAHHSVLREHVTPYIRGNMPGLGHGNFRRADLLGPADFGHIRFTVDTRTDLENMRRLFERLPEGFHWLEAVALASRISGELPITNPPAEPEGLVFREAVMSDAALLFRWLNETDRRQTSLATSSPVLWHDHHAWLSATLDRASCWLAIALYDGLPAGLVRLDHEKNATAISIYADQMFRDRRIGQAMVAEALEKARERWPDSPLVARVRIDNERSATFFNRCGFIVAKTHEDHLLLRFDDGK